MSTAREEAEQRYPATYRYDGDNIPDRESGLRQQAFIAGATWAKQQAAQKIDTLSKPTQHGRYAEAGYNDHFNDGLDAAVQAIEEQS